MELSDFTWILRDFEVKAARITNWNNNIIMSVSHQADPIKRARLRWRARRGLLENDIILTRFLDAHETTLTDGEVEAFSRLMELSDNDLMNLLLQSNEPEGELDLPQVRALLARLRTA